MVQVGTMLNIIDNSGVERVRCIHIYRKTKKAVPGDKILLAVQRVRVTSKIKKGQVLKGILVSSMFKNFYRGGHFTFCDLNGAILLKKNGDILGTRFMGPVYYKVFVRKLSKALSLIDYVY